LQDRQDFSLQTLLAYVRKEDGTNFYKLSSILNNLGDVNSSRITGKNDRILTSLDLKTILSPNRISL